MQTLNRDGFNMACMRQVENGMVESVHERCMEGMRCYPATPREQWVLEWPGQVVLVVSGMFWTQVWFHPRQFGAAR
jgi:hypothetical protein